MKIRQRTKKSPLIFKGSFPPFKKVKIEIFPPHDSSNWFELLRMEPEKLGGLIQRDFVGPVYDYIIGHPALFLKPEVLRELKNRKIPIGPARGIHRGREVFIRRIKNLTAYTYCLVTHWLKKPEDEWPNPLKELVKQSSKYTYHGRRERSKPRRVTAYIMEMDFGKEREKYHLRKWTEDPEAFGRAFISNNKYAKFVKTICRS